MALTTNAKAQDILAGMALAILGGLSFAFVFFTVPQTNHDFIIYTLGALSGALTVGGARTVADKITNSSGPNANVQSDAPPPGGDT